MHLPLLHALQLYYLLSFFINLSFGLHHFLIMFLVNFSVLGTHPKNPMYHFSELFFFLTHELFWSIFLRLSI